MLLLLTALFVCGLGLIVAGLAIQPLGRDRLDARLAALGGRPVALEELELAQPFSQRVLRPLISRLAKLGQRLLGRHPDSVRGATEIERIRRRLDMAGNPGHLPASDWLGVKLFCAVCLVGLMFLLFQSLPLWFLVVLLVSSADGGYVLPEFWLGRRIRARQ
jgi:tight adherence protein C